MQTTGIVFDLTVSVGNMLTMLIAVAGIIYGYAKYGHAVDSLKTDIKDLKEDVGGLRQILVTLGQHDIKFTNMESNVVRIQRELDDLRRGEGFILPIAGKRG